MALGAWFAELPKAQQPDVVICSPYIRARETARIVLDAMELLDQGVKPRIDERLREKEFGILDRLTVHGISQQHPALFDQRYVAELVALTGDAGAKRLIRQYPDDCAGVPFPLGAVDLDTRQDVAAWRQTDPAADRPFTS